MRLSTLAPKWWLVAYDGGTVAEPRRVGVSFACPVHAHLGLDENGIPTTCGNRFHIAFANPPDGGQKTQHHANHWVQSGETFETLTLSPSVHYVGHWHGWVINGEVTTVP